MSNLVSYNYNLNVPTSGTIEEGNVSYATASFVGSGSFGLIWGYEVCSISGYTFITDSYTQSYAPLSSSATPLFYVTTTTTSIDVLDTINRLPYRITQPPFTYINSALKWVSGSGEYITLYTCSVYDYPANLLQEDGFYLLQENGSLIELEF